MTSQKTKWEDTVSWVGVVCGCVIKRDGKYLLIQEKQPKFYGLWNIPAGFVDKGEDIEHAAIRETKEECGFDVELIAELGVYHEIMQRPVKHIFEARIIGGELKVQENEILDAKWLTYEEIRTLGQHNKLRSSWTWDVISRLEKKSPSAG